MVVDAPPLISPSIRKWIVVSALLGYTALILYLLYFVGINELISVIGSINVGVYFFAIASVLISLTFHTLVWFQLLRTLSINLSFRRTYVLYWVGIFVDNLIPGGWSGDLFKAYLLNKDPSVESGKAVASVVAKNVYEAIFNLGSMVLGIVLLLLNYTLEGSLLFTLGGIMLLLTLPLAVLLLASFKPVAAKKLVAALFRFISRLYKNLSKLANLEAKVQKALGDYHEGMKELLQNPRVLFKPMILSLFAWGFEVIALLFVFASLGQLIPIDKVVIVRSIAGNVEAQGYAFVGYAQIISSEIYNALGVPFAVGASVALLSGVVLFLLKTVISYVAFQFTIFSPRSKIIGRKRQSENNEKTQNVDKQNFTQEQTAESVS
jgi:glycosyltransferase 2 family protein